LIDASPRLVCLLGFLEKELTPKRIPFPGLREKNHPECKANQNGNRRSNVGKSHVGHIQGKKMKHIRATYF
jgi:hypothetical protein